jgi:D-alanyl-D-alanine carboxypeptidase
VSEHTSRPRPDAAGLRRRRIIALSVLVGVLAAVLIGVLLLVLGPRDAEPTAAVAPTSSAAPSATATPSASATPSAEPAPTETAEPTLEPSPEATEEAPEPTEEPTEQPAPAEEPSAEPQPAPPVDEQPTPQPAPPAAPQPAPPVSAAIDDPSSVQVVVNKLRPLTPLDYAPAVRAVNVPGVNGQGSMRPVAADAIEHMFADYTAETGLQMQSNSTYRSYATQVDTYNGWVSQLGQAEADKVSARPGHSEHQTGLVMDITDVPNTCGLDACFGGTPQGVWLAQNAWRYGFVIRYPQGMTHITGYSYEPWHVRYVGEDVAGDMYARGILTLEEYYGLPAAPDYIG